MGFEWKLDSLRLKMSSGPQSSRISPRKFSEKIALLNKKEREANAKFEQIINEVHSSIGQPQQPLKLQCRRQPSPAADSTRPGSQLGNEELQAMIESTRYQAAHSDSLEEIERVYENLIKSVGQCDNAPAADTNRQQEIVARTSANSDHSTLNSNSTSTTCTTSTSGAIGASNPLNAASPPFYPNQRQQSNQFQSTTLDLNNNALSRAPLESQNADYIPCGPLKAAARPVLAVTDKNLFSDENVLETCVSSSYLPHAIQQQQDICMPDSQTRGRVVSFGSASGNRYRVGPAFVSQHEQLAVDQQVAGCRGHETVAQQQAQYLEEPAGDRCRLKSCSDPQLNVLAPGQYESSPIDQRKSDNRLAIGSAQQPAAAAAGHTTAPFTCCSSTASSHIQMAQGENTLRQSSTGEYFLTAATRVDSPRGTGRVATTSGAHFDPCDTTDGRAGELPGIEICTIGDNGQQYAASNQRQVFDNVEAQSRDSSLPDISTLHFANNSAGKPAEDHQHYRPLNNWPPVEANGQYCPMKQNGTAHIQADSCGSRPTNSWHQFEAPAAEVKMEVQTSDQLAPVSSAGPQETGCWTNQASSQHALKTGCNLSSSDYGFSTSSGGSHHQPANLVICASSELYNNIFRSRSHSNIDYLAKQAANAKRPHLYAEHLAQFEGYHTSQYCLQTAEQPAMNVRRIDELKAQGSSTSPLNSSSNLNSPQSDLNSPGSSTTTEQCESAAIMFGQAAGQQDFYQLSAVPGEPTTQFLQYAPASTTMVDIRQQKQQHQHQHQQQHQQTQPHAAFEGSSQQCVQIIGRQSGLEESYMEQGGGGEHQLCQPSSTTTRTSLFDGASPSSTTTDNLNYIHNER